jgi:hypothetical protein
MAKRSLFVMGLVLLMTTLLALPSWAVMPTVLSYQGKLTDTSGVPVPDGTYQIMFFFYDDVVAGTALWKEEQNVLVTDGIYNVHLGYIDIFPATFFVDNDDLYLEVQVYNSSTSSWEILSPRQQVVCSAFSMKAQYAEKAIDGSITTVMLAPDAVTDEKIKDETVTAADIKNGSVLAVDIQDGQVLQEILDDDGPGSGLDADRLDGLEASAFMAAGADNWVNETGDTMTGNLEVQARVMAQNSSTTYAGHFVQTGATNSTGGLYAYTANGRYGERLYNGGGYTGGITYGLYANTIGNSTSTYDTYGIYSQASDSNSPVYGFFGNTDSSNSLAYGAYFDVDSSGGGTYGLDVDSHNSSSTGGNSTGMRTHSSSTNGQAIGIDANTTTYSGSTSDAYGLRNYVNQQGSGSGTEIFGLWNKSTHYGTSGTAYGIVSSTYGSDEGDAYGAYFLSNKPSSDIEGTAYGGHFIGDNDRANGTSYGLYTEATGLNGTRYGLYSEVTTSGAIDHPNYGVYSQASTSHGNVYGFYADVDSTSNYTAYGQYVALSKPSGSGNLYGNYAVVDNDGTDGYTYGTYSYAFSSDSTATYGGYFRADTQASTDSGNLYGVYARATDITAGTSYGLYAYGGDWAGFFVGDVWVTSDFTALTKNFVQPHKSDPKKEIVYVSLEGPEHAVFIRGNATLKNGKAIIEMPEEWQQVAAEEGITINLTPLGSWAPLYAESVSKSQVIVRVAKGGDNNVSFSYYIMAKRDGFQEHKPIQENKHFTADGISAWEFEKRYEEDSMVNRAASAMLKSNGILNAQGKLNESTASTLGWKVIPNEEDPNYLAAHGLIRPEDSPEKQSPPPRPSHPEAEEVRPPEQTLKISTQ